MRIIAVTNQKGGVGKTTVAVNLAACLGLAGRRVVLADLDPQGNVAQGLGLEPAGDSPLSDALLYGEPLVNALLPTAVPGLEVVPSDGVVMETTEARLYERLDGLEALGLALADLASLPHDYAVLDCRPSLGRLTLGAILAADYVLAPIEAGRYALEGLASLTDATRRLWLDAPPREGYPHIRVANLRLVVNKYNARRAVSEWMDGQLAHAGAALLQTRVRASEAIGQAAIAQQPVALYAPRSAAAADFHALAAEVEALWA
jgi:chromosome partitioning protein